MATASLFDMSAIAQDVAFSNRVKASLYAYCTTTLQSETANNHPARRSYASQVMNNPNEFIPDFTWAAASNQTLADGIITNGNVGLHFDATTTSLAIAAAVAAGGTDTNINNAVANAFNALANA